MFVASQRATLRFKDVFNEIMAGEVKRFQNAGLPLRDAKRAAKQKLRGDLVKIGMAEYAEQFNDKIAEDILNPKKKKEVVKKPEESEGIFSSTDNFRDYLFRLSGKKLTKSEILNKISEQSVNGLMLVREDLHGGKPKLNMPCIK